MSWIDFGTLNQESLCGRIQKWTLEKVNETYFLFFCNHYALTSVNGFDLLNVVIV